VLLGLERLQMKDFTFTNLGNVGVNADGGTMHWGRKSYFEDGTQVVADILNRAGQASSLACLFTNETHSPLGNISIRDCGGVPVPWDPQPLIFPLPPNPSCAPGTMAVAVEKAGSLTLGPGAYGQLRVHNGGVLELTGGSYCFADVRLGRGARIVVKAPVSITSMGRYLSGPSSRLVPEDGSGVGAAQIAVGVNGPIVKLSHKNRSFAVFYAPNAIMRFGRFGKHTGQFVARVLRSDFGNAFTYEVCGNDVIDPGEECDPGPDGDPCCTDSCEFEPQGTPCPDGDVCNGDEVCGATGQCAPGTHLVCNDGKICTTDSCIPASGCHYENKPDLTPCADDLFCNGDEVCIGGACTDQADPNCDDGDPCTSNLCDEDAGACLNPPLGQPGPGCDCPNGDDDCDNGNVCDGIETCDPSGQLCHPGTPLVCTTTNPCLEPGCDSASGCFVESKPDGTPCDDGDACSVDDQCTGGVCGGIVNGCDDGDRCTNDSCDPETGDCVHEEIPGCGGQTGGPFCGLTQGAYGAPGGIANGGQGWITNNPGVLPEHIGFPGTGQSVTVHTQDGLIAFMPTGGTSGPLDPVDVDIYGPADVPDPTPGGSGGSGAGVLAGQTLALKLSVALSDSGANPTGFGNYQLVSEFCTCDGLGGLAGPFTIPQCILTNAVTVDDLITLADQALAGVPLGVIDHCLTYSDITAALDALNRGFDECRTVCSCTP
jgi:hypothetical protein